MSDLTAIDVLVDPDENTLRHARDRNARMRESVPDGFALDASHQPHITTLQRYVRTAQLESVYAAIGDTLAATDTSALSYRAVAIKHADWGVPGQGLAVILVQPSEQVLDFQAALLAAVTPFTEPGGTSAAFVTDPGEDISQSTRDWVEDTSPPRSGRASTRPTSPSASPPSTNSRPSRPNRSTPSPSTRPPSPSTNSATAEPPANSSRPGPSRADDRLGSPGHGGKAPYDPILSELVQHSCELTRGVRVNGPTRSRHLPPPQAASSGVSLSGRARKASPMRAKSRPAGPGTPGNSTPAGARAGAPARVLSSASRSRVIPRYYVPPLDRALRYHGSGTAGS